jgi:hypothetical protein
MSLALRRRKDMFGNSQKPLLMACALAIGLAAGPAQAQVTATLVLKNGQRHTGQNLGYRLDRPEVAVRTSQHEEPRVPLDQVAYVDFGGSSDANVDLSGSEQAVVMRDGTVVKGQVIELGHSNRADQSTPYLVVFRTSNGEERRLPVGQVARVYFSGSSSSVPTTGSAQVPEGQGIAVAANQHWTPTGMNVRRGEVLTFNSTGEARLSTDPADIAGPPGARSQRYAKGSPLPGNFAGALIARIGNGAPFPIGDQTTVPMPAAGQLFLGINDDDVADNSGGFRVSIRRANRR